MFENPPIPAIALVFNMKEERLRYLLNRLKPYGIQFLSQEDFDFIKKLKKDFPKVQFWQSVHLPAEGCEVGLEDIKDTVVKYIEAGIDLLLFDTVATVQGLRKFGGTGLTSDWGLVKRLMDEVDSKVPVLLAGGINPENVAEALSSVNPDGIDLCSGVEAVPGKKDPLKVKALMNNIRRRWRGRKMKAAVVYGKDDIRVEEYPTPEAGKGEIIVKIKASGICATDVKTLLGQGLPKNLPTILGHEVVGEIYQLGEGVKGFNIGDRVAVYPIAVCGECYYCKNGKHNLCMKEFGLGHGIDGGFAQYVKLPEQIVNIGGVVKIPDTLSYEKAVISEPLSCGIAALRANRVKPETGSGCWCRSYGTYPS